MMDKLEIIRSFSHRCNARELANEVINEYYSGKEPTFPINIFKMLSDFKIAYKFMNLENLDGMYSPDSEKQVAVVGINMNNSYERQRFTAAHELCHHLRDYMRASVSEKDDNSQMEAYANKFASELLIPSKYLRKIIRRYQNEQGYVQPDNALYLCQIFGTSFENMMWTLHSRGYLDFELDKEYFNQINLTEKPFDMEMLEYDYLKNIINNYSFISQSTNSPLWLRLKNELIYNDTKIEGLELEKEIVAEICTDLRIFKEKSSYYDQFIGNPSIIETVGQYFLYEMLYSKEKLPSQYDICELNKTLYTLATNSEQMGRYRETDNSIVGSKHNTTPYTLIRQEMYFLDMDIQHRLSDIHLKNYTEVIEFAVFAHHKLTQIHPFEDGNGRTARSLMNWLLNLKKLPPVYVEADQKSEYLDVLALADDGIFEEINKFFMKRILISLIMLNSELSIQNVDLVKNKNEDQTGVNE